MNDILERQQQDAAGTASIVLRRSLLGGLAAGLLAAAGLDLADAKKGGKGKGRGKGKGKGKRRGKGRGKARIQICHRNGQGFALISVSKSSRKAHEAHGDVVCEAAPCQIATSCSADGACVFAQAAAGEPCRINGATGACTAEGTCAPNP